MKVKLTKQTIITLIIGSLFSINILANNEVNCTGGPLSGSFQMESCYHNNMPLYNQRVVSNMHCVPTAAIMGLDTIIDSIPDYSADYYTNYPNTSDFGAWLPMVYAPVYSASIEDKINAMGDLMGTTATGGTSGTGSMKYPALAQNFVDGIENNETGDTASFDNNFFIEKLKESEIGYMVYGHYKQTCKSIGTYSTCSYSRGGGHAVSLNGFLTWFRMEALTTFDPYGTDSTDPNGGLETARSIEKLELQSIRRFIDNRPYGNSSYVLFISGNQVKVIDSWRAIDTN